MSKKVKIFLAVSVLLNFLLIGLVMGHISHRGRAGKIMERRVRRLASHLPPAKKTLFLDTLRKVYEGNRDVYEEIRASRRRIVKVMSDPEFDEDAYQAEVDKIHELRGRMMKHLSDATKDLAKKFSPEERKALADHLLHPPRPMFGKKALHHGPLPPPGGK